MFIQLICLVCFNVNTFPPYNLMISLLSSCLNRLQRALDELQRWKFTERFY